MEADLDRLPHRGARHGDRRASGGGVFERHPDLHVIMTEGYAGWLAFDDGASSVVITLPDGVTGVLDRPEQPLIEVDPGMAPHLSAAPPAMATS